MTLKLKQSVEEIFLAKSVELKTTKSGSAYLDMILCTKDESYPAKIWNYTQGDPLDAMKLYRVFGTTEEFSGQIQIKISKIEAVDESEIDITDYVPSAPIAADIMMIYIEQTIDTFENRDLKTLVSSIVERYRNELLIFPAATVCHDAVRSGLLHHTYNMMQSAKQICSVYKDSINQELLLAGVILHDVAKIFEIDACELGIASDYSVKGKLFGHLYMGAEMIAQIGKETGVDDEIIMLIEHMILSHHGKTEYGAVKPPMIIEAQVLSLLDDLDAKIYEFDEALKDTEPGTMSKKVFSLGNIQVYKPTFNA